MAHIEQWRANAPWQESYQVEQDLLISRTIIAIYNDDVLKEKLGFRGGTALHKLFINPALRYSENIDLVQLDAEPIGPMMKRIDEVVDFFDQKRSTSIGGHGTKAIYKYRSEESDIPLKIKIEINCQEHRSSSPMINLEHTVENPYFNGTATLKTYQLNELLGSKLRALYQRNKGRDLFDLFNARNLSTIDPKAIISCFYHYMNLSKVKPPTSKQFVQNLNLKLDDLAFKKDMDGLVKREIKYNIHEAHEWITNALIPLIDINKPPQLPI